MRWGISGELVDASLPYAAAVNAAALANDFPPKFIYAIAWHESIQGEVNGKWIASSVVSGDGGHGLCQLTSSWCMTWDDPEANARYAIQEFLLPDIAIWTTQFGMIGDTLIKCVAASYNAGLAGAEAGHAAGDVDRYDTNEYGAAVLAIYHNLVATGHPG